METALRWSDREIALLERRCWVLGGVHWGATLVLCGDGTYGRPAAAVIVPATIGDTLLETYAKTENGVVRMAASGHILARAQTLGELWGGGNGRGRTKPADAIREEA